MKFKKFLAVLLAATMIFSMSAVGLTASAASVHPQSATAAVQDIELKSDFELAFSKMFRQMFNGILEMFRLYNAMSVTEVSIAENSYTVAVGERVTIKAETLPSRAKNNTIHWMSEDSSIATVGSTGVVIGKSVGKTTIYAVADDGGFYDKCTVKVTAGSSSGGNNENEGSSIACTDVNIVGLNSAVLKLSEGADNVTVGKIEVTPANTTDSVSVISSAPTVASGDIVEGYLVVTLDRFNNAKKAEVLDRVTHYSEYDCEDVYVS